jgi:hypothetical protein
MRGIQYAAACRFHHDCLWNTGSPAFAGDDSKKHSRGAMRPKFCISFALFENRGRGEDRVRAAPAVSQAMCIKKCAHEHTGSAVNTPASPTQRLYGLYEFALVTGFLATIIGRDFRLHPT